LECHEDPSAALNAEVMEISDPDCLDKAISWYRFSNPSIQLPKVDGKFARLSRFAHQFQRSSRGVYGRDQFRKS